VNRAPVLLTRWMACYLADDDHMPGEWVDGEWFLSVQWRHRVGHPAVVAVVGVTRVHSTDHQLFGCKAKTAVSLAVAAKPEVEIWRQPQKSTS